MSGSNVTDSTGTLKFEIVVLAIQDYLVNLVNCAQITYVPQCTKTNKTPFSLINFRKKFLLRGINFGKNNTQFFIIFPCAHILQDNNSILRSYYLLFDHFLDVLALGSLHNGICIRLESFRVLLHKNIHKFANFALA